MNRWDEHFRVRTFEAGTCGLAGLGVLCGYLQEAAANHAEALGLSHEVLLDKGLAWVLVRIHVRVEETVRWKDALTVRTWPVSFDRAGARRDFLLLGSEERVLGSAVSQWAVVDLRRRRLAPIPDFIREKAPGRADHALEFPTRRVDAPGDAPGDASGDASGEEQCVQRFPVRRADLDFNGHVNNVAYISWVLETVPEGIPETKQAVAADVSFRAESHYGDVAEVVTAEVQERKDAHEFRHGVRRLEDGRELVRARTWWR